MADTGKRKKHTVLCAVILDQQNRVLLAKRARDPGMGKWALLSGIGASVKGLEGKEAIIDEVKEDIGVEFIGKLFFEENLSDDEFANKLQVYVGKINGELRLNPKAATDYKWFELKDAVSEDLAFDHVDVLNRYINEKK